MYALLTALPWVGRELFEKKENDLERIMAAMEGYLLRRNTSHVAALRVWNCDTPHPQVRIEQFIILTFATNQYSRKEEYLFYLLIDSTS